MKEQDVSGLRLSRLSQKNNIVRNNTLQLHNRILLADSAPGHSRFFPRNRLDAGLICERNLLEFTLGGRRRALADRVGFRLVTFVAKRASELDHVVVHVSFAFRSSMNVPVKLLDKRSVIVLLEVHFTHQGKRVLLQQHFSHEDLHGSLAF